MQTINLVLNNGKFHCIVTATITKVSGDAIELRIHTSDGSVIAINASDYQAAQSFVDQAAEDLPGLVETIRNSFQLAPPPNDGVAEEGRAKAQGLPQDAFRTGTIAL